jgi:FAD/FMN-containing dehydrogenase
MTSTTIARLSGGQVEIDAATLDAFGTSLDGSLIDRDDPGYEEARAVWNAMIEKRPALIARCASPADVKRSLDFASSHGLLFSVRGAGHNIAGSALCDGGLTIDLSEMRSVDVDLDSATARVEPGATLGDVDAATLPHGLAVPVGINSTTGIAGLTLGGGFGWLSRKYGLTIDSLRSAEVVTADGTAVTASESENPDLFWGLRGGGGNFGIVTSFEFDLREAGPELLCGLIVHPASDAKGALEAYRAFAAGASDDLTVWVVLRSAPPLPFLSEEVHGTDVVVFAFVCAGDPADGEREIAPLRAYGNPHGEHIGVMPFQEFQQAFDPLLTPGSRNYWKSHNFGGLEDGLVDRVLEYASRLPGPQSEIFIAQVGAATGRVPSDATAYPHRDAAFVLNVHTRWEDAGQDAECVAWAREFFDATAPYATGGTYLNFVSEAEDAARVAAAYGENYDRLRELKAKYDPDNVFRTNLNVRP